MLTVYVRAGDGNPVCMAGGSGRNKPVYGMKEGEVQATPAKFRHKAMGFVARRVCKLLGYFDVECVTINIVNLKEKYSFTLASTHDSGGRTDMSIISFGEDPIGHYKVFPK